MSASDSPALTDDDLADGLARHGWVVWPGFLPAAAVAALRQELQARAAHGELLPAGIGQGRQQRRHDGVRRDHTCWLDGSTPAQQQLLARMEIVRLAINRALFLGLFDYECHFAHYPPGAFYRRHRDAFSGSDARVVTTVLYLNADWSAADGGALQLWDGDSPVPLACLSPQGGSLVCFLSERFPHEVLPAVRDRYSIAGWFRRNASSGIRVDPAG